METDYRKIIAVSLIVLGILVVIGEFLWYWQLENSSKSLTQNQFSIYPSSTSLGNSAIQTSSRASSSFSGNASSGLATSSSSNQNYPLLTYQSNQFGFSFQYPSNWVKDANFINSMATSGVLEAVAVGDIEPGNLSGETNVTYNVIYSDGSEKSLNSSQYYWAEELQLTVSSSTDYSGFDDLWNKLSNAQSSGGIFNLSKVGNYGVQYQIADNSYNADFIKNDLLIDLTFSCLADTYSCRKDFNGIISSFNLQ